MVFCSRRVGHQRQQTSVSSSSVLDLLVSSTNRADLDPACVGNDHIIKHGHRNSVKPGVKPLKDDLHECQLCFVSTTVERETVCNDDTSTTIQWQQLFRTHSWVHGRSSSGRVGKLVYTLYGPAIGRTQKEAGMDPDN